MCFAMQDWRELTRSGLWWARSGALRGSAHLLVMNGTHREEPRGASVHNLTLIAQLMCVCVQCAVGVEERASLPLRGASLRGAAVVNQVRKLCTGASRPKGGHGMLRRRVMPEAELAVGMVS